MTIQEAKTNATREFIRSWIAGAGNPIEADTNLNDAQRDLIESVFATHGEAWLVKINLYDHKDWAIFPYTDTVHNFGASAVLPTFDAITAAMILARDAAPYTSTKEDMGLINAIYARINRVGGYTLIWS